MDYRLHAVVLVGDYTSSRSHILAQENHSQKFHKILKAQFPDLSEEELERAEDNVQDLAQFFVRLFLKEDDRARNSGLSTDFEDKTRDPPV